MDENNVENQQKVKPTTKKDFKPIILYFVVQVLVSLILSFVWMARGVLDSNAILEDPTFMSLYLIFYGLTTTIIFSVLYRQKLANDFKKLTKKKLGFTVLAGVGIVLMNFVVYSLFKNFNIPTENQDTLTSLADMFKLPYFFTLVFFFPFTEEFVCRYSLRTIFSNKIAFVLVSSIVFALLHGLGVASILYFLLGVGFSLVYIKSDDNIICSFIAHALNNLVGAISLFF